MFSNFLYTQEMFMADGKVFEQYNGLYGLSSNSVYNILEDKNGFLWVGTSDGLNVLDGHEVKIFKSYINEGKSFRGRPILSIFEDSKGNILCGTKEKGLNIYDRSKGKFVNIYNPLLINTISKKIKSTIELSENKYALLTDREYLIFNLVDNKVSNIKSFAIHTSKQEYPKNLFYINNELFISTNKRLLKADQSNISTVFKSPRLQSIKKKNGKLWILEQKKLGFFNNDLSTINWINFSFNTESQYFLDFDITSENRIWIGARKVLIEFIADHNLKEVYSKFYDSKVEIYKVFVDASDNIFLGTSHGQGLVKLSKNQQSYEYIYLPKGNENLFRYSFMEDKNQYYWIGGNRGVFAYNSREKKYHKFKDGEFQALKYRQITELVKDDKDDIWFGTSNGVAQFNLTKNDFTFYGENLKDQKGNWNSFTSQLELDKNQNLWFISFSGLNMLDSKTKQISLHKTNNIRVIFIDKNNNLWAIERNKGLVKYDISKNIPIQKKVFPFTLEFAKQNPHNIIADKKGRLWISTFNGIYIYDYNKEVVVHHLNRSNLLKKEKIYRITPDFRGNFWVGQEYAPAICISSETFEIIETAPEWMRQFGENKNYANLAYVAPNGKIFTMGTGGFFVYNIDSLKVNDIPPKFVLNKLKINGTEKFNNFLGAENLVYNNLSYNENSIEISLKTVNQKNTYNTQYSYRLVGNSNEWIYTKKLNDLNFNTLQPNSYQLQVKSTNNGKTWSAPMTLVSFQILSPWWKTVYAYIIYIGLISSVLFIIYKIQINRKLAESESSRLKQLDDFKNKFFQNITHEFRTPLTVILGNAEKIESNISKVIKRNADQLLKLVNELLEIGKIESNSSTLKKENNDIIQFIRYCTQSLESLASQKEIELNFTANQENFFYDFDQEKIQLVMRNLISNAIKFSPEKEEIIIGVHIKNKNLEIFVKDSGPGIPKNSLEKVFDRYYQVKPGNYNTGTGIGLALSKEIIVLMEGSIKAINNNKKGACFIIDLPVNSENNNNLKLSAINENIDINLLNEDRNIVLVIEDNKDVQDYIFSVLESSYEVYTASNGKEGYEKAVEIIPDLIITDVMMPIMDGYEACSQIKSDFRTNHIPIVMLTAKADINSKISGLNIGADAYLGKPFHKEELLAHIKNLIRIRENLKEKYSQSSILEDDNKNLNPFVEKLTQLITNNLSSDSFGIMEICKEIGVSRTQLHRKLKALTGLSTSIFIREIRLKESYKILSKTQLNVSEAAYSVGFNDPFYFSKLFTEKYKVTPSSVKRKFDNS